MRTPYSAVTIHTVDRPGGDFEAASEEVVRQLESADGILFLFDPSRELNENQGDGIKSSSSAWTGSRTP